jgi:hypothetical protein
VSLDWSKCPAVESVPGKVSGAWVFGRTRMPVAAVFEDLVGDGLAIDEIAELYVSSASGHDTPARIASAICMLVALLMTNALVERVMPT